MDDASYEAFEKLIYATCPKCLGASIEGRYFNGKYVAIGTAPQCIECFGKRTLTDFGMQLKLFIQDVMMESSDLT
jgi:hypothetical protein